MQYGVEIYPYERIKKLYKSYGIKKSDSSKRMLYFLIYFLTSFMFSRASAYDGFAPFGIALVISTAMKKDTKGTVFTTLGTITAILLSSNYRNSTLLYFAWGISILFLAFLTLYISRNKALTLIFVVMGLEYVLLVVTSKNYNLEDLLISLVIKLLVILTFYWVFSFLPRTLDGLKTCLVGKIEEKMSVVIAISLLVAGTWGLNILWFSARSILAILIVLSTGFIYGISSGASIGLVLGLFISMNYRGEIEYATILGLMAIASGFFNNIGKIFSASAVFFVFLILDQWVDISYFNFMDVITAAVVFTAIPSKYYKVLRNMKKNTKKDIWEDNEKHIKKIFNSRLESFTEVLYSIVSILNKLVDKEGMDLKFKSSSIVENLANKMCSDCNLNSICWKRELHFTYNAMSELIQSYQEGNIILPEEIKRKCIKKNVIFKATEEVMKNHAINEMWKKRLSEGRELLANQIKNIAISMEELICDFNSEIIFDRSIEAKIKMLLEAEGITFNELICIKEKKSRLKIKLTLLNQKDLEYETQSILEIIGIATGKKFMITSDPCEKDRVEAKETFNFEEMPRYDVKVFEERFSKSGELHSGDSIFCGKIRNESYTMLLCDGMGHGAGAYKESSAVVDLIKALTNAGFSKETAINTANSIMSLEFNEEEKFSTVDLCSVDLFTGDVEMMKLGAVPSFILRDGEIITIQSKTLPIGVLDNVDVATTRHRSMEGAMVVMTSDGVLDSGDSLNLEENWILPFLKKFNHNNAEIIAKELIREAINRCEGNIQDDMTVLVCKINRLQ